ncbi:hypothetical protein [Methanosarcina sp.]|uniref:hypothetical protein n=1 Tax=Methanosarcina sp. TaxID=2213 RepID=UPI003BB4ABCF
MTIGNSKKYGIILIGALSLLILGALALSDSSQDDIKLSNNTDEPINITVSSSVLKCTHADLNNDSDIIVIGTVKEILPSKWNTIDGEKPKKENTKPDQDSFIYTDIIISVDEYLKNPLSSKEVIVRTYGGKVGNDSIKFDLEAEFKPDERVLLYLSKDTSPMANDDSKHFFVYGSMQGKFTLTDDGKAIRPDENTTLEELLSTIKDSNNILERSSYPEASNTDEPANSTGMEEPITSIMSASLPALNHMELNNYSDTIIIGTVKEILPSKWNTADGKRPANTDEAFSPSCLIYTDVVISIDEYLKNPLPSKEVTVRVWGGTVRNDNLMAEDEPSFETGEKVLLYLMKDSSPGTKDIAPEHFRVTGLLQGKYTLNDDGKATRLGEDTTLDDLLSTIKD